MYNASARMNERIKYPCPCCGYKTLSSDEGNTFEICPVCFWEDDGVQLNDPKYSGGANTVSLNKARENYNLHGACEKQYKADVRPPLREEKI